ncbi:hypothetical protein FOA43_000333 [Brettanomyces nanus]|uniref:Uncharacterized protein n=1 Tax=Eeniella nana TaxID=13502 RepID=A0A875RZD9_EENNA|nr:uncharacterized protein FOA43_000333 [Brettanomyces nanus]QPG73029.1 hypothetical protein FOA43_000333 [Brettanomyces nanus]
MPVNKLFRRKGYNSGKIGNEYAGDCASGTAGSTPGSTFGPTQTSSASPTSEGDERPAEASNISGDSSTYKSFQYSYNSNTNSLFSSKKTVSTGHSTQPSSSYRSYKKSHLQPLSNEQNTQVQSVGLPLRVVHEEELEEDDEVSVDHISSLRQSSTQRKRSDLAADDPHSTKIDRERLSSANDAGGNSSIASSHSAGAVTSQITEYELQKLIEFVLKQLKQLSIAVSNVMIQVSQSVINLTKASITISENIEKTTQTMSANEFLPYLPAYQFSTISSVGLRRLIKYVLFLIDNIITEDVYNNSKSLVLTSLYKLLLRLKLIEPSPADASGINSCLSLLSPEFFPIGATIQDFPDQDKVAKIMQSMTSKPKRELFSDQDGSFIAPVLRGFNNENLAVITFIFGFPEPTREYRDVIKYFSTNSEDMHFMVIKDLIVPAANTHRIRTDATLQFKSPYRTLNHDSDYFPISMSIACNNALILSGTLGGYLYPKVSKNCSNEKLLKYRNSIFGLTCAHVVLNETTLSENNGDPYPLVSVPSPVLINLYKDALSAERLNYNVNSAEYKAYDDAVRNLDEQFPTEEIRIKGKRYRRNLPHEDFGQIVWGERIIDDDKLSDLAIIRIDACKGKKYLNYLGEDLHLNQFDPSLILSNLYVKEVVSLNNCKNGMLNHANLRVFKVGSTTNFTTGHLNGMKMIYWSEGSLKTSEFVISSSNKKTFASGGDSGSFVMSKLADLHDNNLERSLNIHEDSTVHPPGLARKSVLSAFIESFIPSFGSHKVMDGDNQQTTEIVSSQEQHLTGLGLVGMLHSYDGELKQFGLFTPITDILERLKEVTGLAWGVVGCEDDDDENLSDENVSVDSREHVVPIKSEISSSGTADSID